MRQWWLSVYLPPGKLPTAIYVLEVSDGVGIGVLVGRESLGIRGGSHCPVLGPVGVYTPDALSRFGDGWNPSKKIPL